MRDKQQREKLTAREKTLFILVIALAAVLLGIAAYMAVRLFSAASPQEQTEPAHRTDYTAAENTDWSAVVLSDSDGRERLTAGELNYYFWSEYYYLVNAAEQAQTAYFDADKPLSEQAYGKDTTWQQYILEQALATARQTAALVRAGEEAGYELSAAYQTSLDEQIAAFTQYAVKNGFTQADGSGDLAAYLRDSYGEGAAEASFTEYLRRSFYASSYSDYLYSHIEVDMAKVSTYFDAYAEDYEQAYGVTRENSPKLVNLRCVYFIADDTQSEADWQTAEEAALKVQELWQKNPTEEAFAELADTYTQAPGAKQGGLYEDVYPNGMEQVIDAWCFQEGRKAGDMELLKDDNGYILAYLSSFSKLSYWQYLARKDMLYEEYQNMLSGLISGFEYEVIDSAIAIAVPAGSEQSP